jgi:hypothetical protein
LKYKIIVILLIFIIITNVGYSYKLFSASIYGDLYEGVLPEILKLITPQKLENSSLEFKEIGDLLKKRPGIENSYVMAQLVNYAFYANSKFIYTDFRAGEPSDSLNDFVQRKNWSDYDLYISNIHSYPRDKFDLNHPSANYIIYREIPYDDNTLWYQKPTYFANMTMLTEPSNGEMPTNFELLYHSNKTNTFVYQIHYDK